MKRRHRFARWIGLDVPDDKHRYEVDRVGETFRIIHVVTDRVVYVAPENVTLAVRGDFVRLAGLLTFRGGLDKASIQAFEAAFTK